MSCWKPQIDLDAPCWENFRSYLELLPGDVFPHTDALNELLPPGTSSHHGAAIRFVPANELPGVDYERHIYLTGQVATRQNNWHDLFNALVWCRLPRLKAAMNSLHFQHLDRARDGGRGGVRDALTLLDESGVLVYGPDGDALDALASQDWDAVFLKHRQCWGTKLRVLICGHAVLEKFLQPYKSITAHALLLRTPGPVPVEQLDQYLGASLSRKGWVDSPVYLSPLPLLGLPGWWAAGCQDRDFYRDRGVFRPPRTRRPPAPVHFLDGI